MTLIVSRWKMRMKIITIIINNSLQTIAEFLSSINSMTSEPDIIEKFNVKQI